ncbi:hypothetical protein B488_07010 [Liberibacter crescens BT-1]|uniref:Rhamnan synthesis protein F n=2 Tax=Liberibacter crescens TaxID=1273132 RepID=L0EVK1_LIBCB|nr:hypothetical protein B488_07010 [Liberibacter crescens BT-1]
MTKSLMPFDSKQFTYIPHLFEGWQTLSSENNCKKIDLNSKVVIVVHVFYAERWFEIAHLLSGLNFFFDLMITTVEENRFLEPEFLKLFPSAHVYFMENKGRDIKPFLTLLESGKLDQYDYICKIHGKESRHQKRSPIEGTLWRRWLFYDLLGAPNTAVRIIETFKNNPSIGMIGSRRYRRRMPYSRFIRRQEKNTRVFSLTKRMNFPTKNLQLDFFFGTMFWVRRISLEPIKKLELSKEFLPESGLLNGALEHSVERVFSISVMKAGFCIHDVDAVDEANH